MNDKWHYPGARWWKFDFHTHTPASMDTSAWQQANGTSEEVTPEQWLLKYMAAEIDCVAITDHNSGVWIDKLKEAYAKMKENQPKGFRELHLFPGVEISVQSGFHLLAIFDISTVTSDIDTLLGSVKYIGDKGDSNGVTREGVTEVIQIVLNSGGLPIPAHVDENKGLLRLEAGSQTKAALDANTLRQILEIPSILAMEVVNPTTPMPRVYVESGKQWTKVIGSDCHSFQGSAVPGSRFTWVKMASPSLEGLRLALLDGAGVSVRRIDEGLFDPFRKPEHFIESIEIREAHVMGLGRQPAILSFSPYFNVLVGGRGTGKSTVIHALRLAYRREGELTRFYEKSEPRKTFERFNQVYSQSNKEGGLRENTEIVLTLCRDGLSHQLRWRQDDQVVAVEEQKADDWVRSDSQSITPQRFPVRLFSQGQIAALAGDSQQALLELIDEAAGTHDEKKAFEEAKNTFLSSRSKLRELEGKLQERDTVKLGLHDVQRKLQRFEEAQYAEVLKTYQRCSRQARETNRQFSHATEIVGRLRSLATELLPEDLPDGLFDLAQDQEALDAFKQLSQAIALAKKQMEESAENLVVSVEKIKTELSTNSWQEKQKQSEKAYEELKVNLQAEGINDPADYGRLVQERQGLESEDKRLDGIQKQFEVLLISTRRQFHALLAARSKISKKRQIFLHDSLADNSYVRISLRPFSCQDSDMEHSLRECLEITDGRFIRDIMDKDRKEGLVFYLDNAEPKLKTKAVRDTKHKLIQACKGQGQLGGDIQKRLKKMADGKPDYCDHILCWFPEDGLQVEYSQKGNGKDFDSIVQASAGQRAAAMLAFLLAYGDEPLVLDQPEDDLDNHLIYNLVVEQIRANKQRRQLIIVTHNANIVVNGDAEMVYALNFSNQCYVKEKGSLQDKAMREEVCQIMEGGRDAFERRYRRLGREV